MAPRRHRLRGDGLIRGAGLWAAAAAAAAAAAVAAAAVAAAAATGGYDDDDRRASSRVIRLAAGGDVWRGGPAGTPVHRSGAIRLAPPSYRRAAAAGD